MSVEIVVLSPAVTEMVFGILSQFSGTLTTISVEVFETITAGRSPKLTLVVPTGGMKLLPEIVISSLKVPLRGDIPVITEYTTNFIFTGN